MTDETVQFCGVAWKLRLQKCVASLVATDCFRQ